MKMQKCHFFKVIAQMDAKMTYYLKRKPLIPI